MGVFNPAVQARTAVTVAGLSVLAAATYVASNTITHNANKPADVVIEVEAATTNVVAGNKQLKVFYQASLDGTNFQSGPTSGTTTTDEPDLTLLGPLPMNTSTTTHRALFSLMDELGYIPHSGKIVIQNDLGVALTSGAVYMSEISATYT